MNTQEHVRPNFTAWLVVTLMAALESSARWRTLVPTENYPLYRAFSLAYAQRHCINHMLFLLPDALKLFLIDRLSIWGSSQHFAMRKQAIEQQAQSSIESQGIRQIVVIGAGFDLLSLRLAVRNPTVTCYELDLPATQALKQQVLREIRGNTLPTHAVFVPCDLSTQDLATVLTTQCPGFRTDQPTLFVAEGLMMYLTEAENDKLFTSLATLLPHQRVEFLFTTIERVDDGHSFRELVRKTVLRTQNTLFTWAIRREEMPEYCREHGFRHEYTKDYATLQQNIRSEKELTILRRQKGELLHYAVCEGK